MRHRKTDAHIATIRVSVPISARSAASVQSAADAVENLAGKLPHGSTLEILNSRFGRMEVVATARTPRQMDIEEITLTNGGPDHPEYNKVEVITAGAVDPLDPPGSLRRVPRPAPNGG